MNEKFLKKQYETAINESEIGGREIHALELLRSFSMVRPDFRRVLLNYGFCLGIVGRLTDAISALDKALELDNGLEEDAHILFLKGELFSDFGFHEKAEKFFEMTSKTKIGCESYFWELRGMNFYSMANFQQAFEYLEEASKLSPDQDGLDEVLANMGDLLITLEHYREAREVFEKALLIDPDYIQAKNGLEELKGIDQTHKLVGKIKTIAGNPSKTDEEFLDEVYDFAEKEYEKKRACQAIAILREYLVIRKNEFNAWDLYGRCLRFRNRKFEAIKAFERALELCKNNDRSNIYYQMGILHAEFMTPKNAEKWFRLAVESAPVPSFYFLVARGKNFGNLGGFKQAIECYEQALDCDPETIGEDDVAIALYEMGKVFRGEGRYDEAIATFKEALDIDPSHQEARIALDGLDGIDKTLKLCVELQGYLQKS